MTAFFRPAVLRDTLIARGASREEAERLSEPLSAAFGEDVATRHDLEGAKLELRSEIVAVRRDLDVAKTELRSEIVAVRRDLDVVKTELRSEIQTLGVQVRSEVQVLAGQLRDEIRGVKLWVVVGALGFVATAINLDAVVWRGIR